MKLVTTAEWGANPSKEATEDFHPIGSTLGVTLHWEGPHMGPFDHSQCAGKVRAIERFHEYGRGWGDIAYNLLVCPHGYVFVGRGAGVRSAANGDTQENEDWYAVCYLGGEGDGFTDAGKAGMVDAVAYLRAKGGAGPDVNGHRDHKATACPGDEIYRWLRSTDFDQEAPVSFKLADIFRYRLYGQKGGQRTLADVLRQISADVAAIRKDVAELKKGNQ